MLPAKEAKKHERLFASETHETCENEIERLPEEMRVSCSVKMRANAP
jgi:hypothetical protein